MMLKETRKMRVEFEFHYLHEIRTFPKTLRFVSRK